MNEIEPLPCPFCGWKNIRVIECPKEEGIFRDSLYTYAWCKPCGTRGPWAYNIDDDDETAYRKCVERWNERDGIKQSESQG